MLLMMMVKKNHMCYIQMWILKRPINLEYTTTLGSKTENETLRFETLGFETKTETET